MGVLSVPNVRVLTTWFTNTIIIYTTLSLRRLAYSLFTCTWCRIDLLALPSGSVSPFQVLSCLA